MTLTVTQVTDWLFARNAGEKISREIREVRNKYIGKAAVETMPNGKEIWCIIRQIDWEDAYGLNGGWAVKVEYLEGLLKGQSSWTSDRVLTFKGGK